ncbi:hypothetical protein NQ317_004444 [Molorchus minor]|uniref:Uncharacterized protein n=1 Tax=Molorchus minor TaxID=1323400 RepID=A0ABQ9IZ56_9CUCU|nr:hypothetical protein NQ317_004444 [Molorchus minor]
MKAVIHEGDVCDTSRICIPFFAFKISVRCVPSHLFNQSLYYNRGLKKAQVLVDVVVEQRAILFLQMF